MISRLKDSLLLIGDSASDRAALRQIFQGRYHLLEAETVAQSTVLIRQNGGCIAAILADLPMDNADALRRLITACHPGSPDAIPVILFVTPSAAGAQEEFAFALGVTDVITRPYSSALVQHRVQVVVDLFLHQWHLEQLVNEQHQTIQNTHQIMLDTLSAIIEHRNTESGHHVLRIRRFTETLLKEVAVSCPEYGLTDADIGIMVNASALHDIGKISIPDSILNKPGRLTAEEFEVMKTHTTVGGQMVRHLRGMAEDTQLRYACNIALYHHERWDGNGYPFGLKGDSIPICAQAVGLADAFDALTTPRVYKPALPYSQSVNMILNGECGTFSPKLLECFKRVRTQFVNLATEFSDGHNPKEDHISVPLPGPSRVPHALSASQLSQVKYQALLHHINDTVMELDLDNHLYHVVYNPNPDLDPIIPSGPFQSIIDQLRYSSLHPQDIDVVEEMRYCLNEEFFHKNLRRKTFFLRFFSPALEDYQRYELTFLRVNTGNPNQRIVIAVWHRVQRSDVSSPTPVQGALHTSPALYGLVSTALRCTCTPEQTINAGARELFTLTGYSPEEIDRQFGNQLANMVVPEDRADFDRAVGNQLQQGGRTDTEYRLLRKNAAPIWVLDRSRLYVEEDGQEHVYHAIRDNTQIRATINALQAESERHRLLRDQSEGIIFDLDLNTDTLTCSPRWQKIFGYPPLSAHFLAQLPHSGHFHPDDLSPLLSWADSLRQGKDSLHYQEVRIINSSGKYIWCRIHAQLQRDERTQTNRVVGIIYDIDEFRQATLALKERAERDSLTRLLNKASIQQLVTEHLNSQPSGQMSALLILDLDNFKSINDTYGHLYGDAVLTQIGSNLRRLFRSHDIIGRIGGDEFLIFLKDIPDADLVHSRCNLLLATFRELFRRLVPELNVSCSIGAALSPTHASNYAELYQRADEAMYLAKTNGKDRYKLYNPRDKYDALLENATYANTRIDSNEQSNLTDNSLIRFVFRALYESNDLEYTVNELLAHIGQQFNVSRAYIFENSDDNTACSNTFEWCNKGIPPEKEHLQNISYITDIPGWPDLFAATGML